jgi:hypothetical protein
MHTVALRPALLLLAVVLVVVLPPPPSAGAGEAEITYDPAHGDATGMVVTAASGATGCVAGCAALQLAPGRPIPRGQSMLRFAVPKGTLLIGGEVVLRYRTRHAGASVRLLQRHGSRWVDARRLRAPAGARTVVPLGRGSEEVAVALRVEQAIPTRAIRDASENRVAVERVRLRVLDPQVPSVRWQEPPPEGAAWQRGPVCGVAAAADRGLGVGRIEYAIGDAVGSLEAAPGSRLQPAPLQLGGRVCVETAALEDGVYGTELHALEHGDGSSRSAPVRGSIRVDNTAPIVTLAPLADAEDRLPALRLLVDERASGVHEVSVELDGEPVPVRAGADGSWEGRAPRPLPDGAHRVAWTVSDAAGNVAVGSTVIAVADATPPVIDEPSPLGLASSWAAISVRVADRGSGVAPDAVRIAVDGVEASALLEFDGDRASLAPVAAWTPGEHRVRVVAADRSGNRTVLEWAFHVTAPDERATVPDPPESVADQPANDADALVLVRRGSGPIRRSPAVLRIEARRGGEAAAGLRLAIRWAGGPAVGQAIVDDSGVAVLRVGRLRDGILEVRAEGAELSVPVRLRAGVRLAADRRQVRPGQVVRLVGRVTGTGRTAWIEVRAGVGWKPVTVVPVGAGGRFATPVVVPARGSYAVRARVGSAVSPVIRLTAY